MNPLRRSTPQAPTLLSRIILWCAYAMLIALTLTNLASATFPFTTIDEHGHISYTLNLISTHRWWPDFSYFPMMDVTTNAALPNLNYINHPPTFYWFMKLAHMAFPAWEPLHFRAFTLALSLLAMLLYTRLGITLALSLAGTILYALFPFLFYLYLQMGFYTNDAMALLGGLVATLASLRWLSSERPHCAIFWMGIGVLLASVKLTALLLVGSYIFFCLILRTSSVRALPRRFFLYGILIACISAAPYTYMLLTFGSPAPNTIGQHTMLLECLHCSRPDMNFLAWLSFFLSQFADQLSIPETTFFPILAYIVAIIAMLSSRSNTRISSTDYPLYAVATASGLATLLTLSIQVAFSWHRYREYGWIFDSHVRYYLPLIGAYAAVASHLLKPRTPTTKRPHE